MKPPIIGRAYKFVRRRFTGVLLVSAVFCAPVYLLTWYFDLIDDLFARVFISALVAVMPVAELLSERKPRQSRWELL